MIPIRNELRQETVCHGLVNDIRFRMTGGGMGRPFDGVVNTSLVSQTGPLHFPTAVLSPVLIMGYPTFSTYHPGAFDLFKLSDGYTYTREFTFSDGGSMSTQHSVKYCGDHLKGDFEIINGSIGTYDILSCDPTIETFVPAGPGRIRSHFLMAWHLTNGDILTSTVQSEYVLTHNVSIPYLQFRYITFDSVYHEDSIKQTERLNVFRDIRRLSFPPTQEL